MATDKQTKSALEATEAPFAGTLRGMTAMVAAQLAFLLNDTLNKLASERLPMGEIIFIRGVLATLLVGRVVVALGLHRQLPLLLAPPGGGRASSESSAARSSSSSPSSTCRSPTP